MRRAATQLPPAAEGTWTRASGPRRSRPAGSATSMPSLMVPWLSAQAQTSGSAAPAGAAAG
eukprot:3796213-Lingulodinium_polyedra.AAC.1